MSKGAKPARIWSEMADRREYKALRERECNTCCFLFFCKTMKCASSHMRLSCGPGVLVSVDNLARSESDK